SPFLIEQLEGYPMGGLRDMSEWTVDCWNGLAEYLNKERKLPDDEDRKANKTINLCYALWEERTMKHHNESIQRTRQDREVRHQHALDAISEGAFALTRLDIAGYQVLSDVDEDTGMVTFSIAKTELAKNERIENEEDEKEKEKEEEEEKKEQLDYDNIIDSDFQQKLVWKSRTHKTELNLKKSKAHYQKNAGICLSFSDELESQAQTLFLPVEFSSFGHAAVTGDFDGDGNLELVVSAPHMRFDPLVPSQGAVFVIQGHSLFANENDEPTIFDPEDEVGKDVRSIASRTLYGDPSEPQSRFGWSLAVVDLNQDGIDDLAIGAPGHGAKHLKYDGSVFVYFGHAGSGLSEEPDLVLYHDRTKDEHDDVPKGMNTLAGLGYVVQGLDLTGSGFKDLVIGMPMATTPIKPAPEESPVDENSPINDLDDDKKPRKWKPPKFRAQAGKVLVFLSAAKHTGQKLDTESDWEIHGQDEFGWFGASFAVIPQDHPDSSVLRTFSMSSILSWMSPSRFHRCDFHTKTAAVTKRQILVVGSPTFGVGENEAMTGKIQGFLIPDFGSFQKTNEPPQKIFTIHGDAKFQQLGSILALNRVSPKEGGELQDFLVVGSQSEDILNRLPRIGRLWQAGMVRILDISMLSEGTEVKISDLDTDPDVVRAFLTGSQSMAHLSAAMQVSTNGKSLWLTEPYANSEAGRILEWAPDLEKRGDGDDGRGGRRRRRRRRNALGAHSQRLVHGEYLGDDDDGDDDDDEDRIKQCFIGSDLRGRFGSNLLVADLTKEGIDDIVVTSSHASQYAT
ncbi:Glycosylphosphatidylinositol specific phospholipase D1, partial [Haplosporangium sp. Z 27]